MCNKTNNTPTHMPFPWPAGYIFTNIGGCSIKDVLYINHGKLLKMALEPVCKHTPGEALHGSPRKAPVWLFHTGSTKAEVLRASQGLQKGANAASALSRHPAAEPANFTSSVLTSVMLLEYLSHRTTKAFARKGQIFRGNYRHYGIWPWANKSQWKSLFKIPMINLKNVTALHLPWGLFHVSYLL